TSSGFLGEVAKQWEEAADTFSDLDIKISKIRIGLVLDTKEGALPQMVKPAKYGFGTAFGRGLQWQSWIHKKDLARIFINVLEYAVEGHYNAVAPNLVTK